MRHYKRALLLRALKELYEANFKQSHTWTYTHTEMMLNGYQIVRIKIEQQHEEPLPSFTSTQLNLFA